MYFGKALHICGYILSTVVIVKDGLENFTVFSVIEGLKAVVVRVITKLLHEYYTNH